MPESIFDGLSLRRSGATLHLAYPDRICDSERAAPAAREEKLDFRAASAGWEIREAPFDGLKRFFARLFGHPASYPKAVPAPTDAPLLSCVIVVNENLPFVEEQLLPSLAAHASGHPMEVLLVLNGSSAGTREMPSGEYPEESSITKSFTTLRSAWGAVAAAYNEGARVARGRYVAFLHDDCVIDDPRWIDKCLAALEAGAGAVAGEFRRIERIAGLPVPPIPVAKCVPLVMRKDEFAAGGGFDEFHYVGYEDLDLTLALLGRGLRVAQADIRLRHFGGMSSTLKYCPVPGLAELYALCAVPPAAIIRRFREFVERGVRVGEVDLMRLGLDVQLLYVLKKHRAYLERCDRAYGPAAAALERALTAACPFDATLILPRFREMDRALYETRRS